MSAAALPILWSLLLSAAPAAAQAESAWPVNETPHFVFHHERPGAALGDYTRAEQIYESLHVELWSLVPGMSLQKTHVYIYKDADSYHRGRFHPPPWSGGLLQTTGAEKTLAVFEPVETGVLAHELTHLYFHSYFDEKGSAPPAWLDEGLASILEAQGLSRLDPRLKGPVLGSVPPLTAFLKTRPTQDAPAAWVSGWYQQAQSVAWFVKRGHIDSGFPVFCGKLRDGEDAESALHEAYGYESLAAFDAAWQRWRPTKPAGAPRGLGDQ